MQDYRPDSEVHYTYQPFIGVKQGNKFDKEVASLCELVI